MTRQTRIHWNTVHGKAYSQEYRCDNCNRTFDSNEDLLELHNAGNVLHYCSKGCYNAAAYLIERTTGRKLQLD